MQDLREKITELIEHPETVAAYQSQAAEFICTKYSWDRMMQQTIALYEGK